MIPTGVHLELARQRQHEIAVRAARHHVVVRRTWDLPLRRRRARHDPSVEPTPVWA